MELYEGICGIKEQGPKGDIRLTKESNAFLGTSGLCLNCRDTQGGWRVTHVGSGQAIGLTIKAGERYQEFDEALEKGQKLATIIDWTKPTFEELKPQLDEWRKTNNIVSLRKWVEGLE